jgi:integrase
MPRTRTGTLVPPSKDGLWKARVTKVHEDGTTSRPLYSLGTTDKALARRKLGKLVAALDAGGDSLDATESANAPESVGEYANAWLAKREAQRIVSASDERMYFDRHVRSAIGRLPVCDVRPSHVRGILDEAAAKGLRRATVAHIRGVMNRIFRAALEDEITEHNPVAAVRVPKMREVRKERAILTDEEFATFIGCPEINLELRMLSLVARCEGGMRTGDLNRWDWTQIERVHFAECIVPRAKTGTPQVLAIPDTLSPFLRAWWERAGKPESGPVFPARAGKRAGGFRAPAGHSYARRLRQALFCAGIWRMPPVQIPATKPGMRSDLGKLAEGTKLAPNPRDPLYFETATTLPVDFHSFRRAFASALAEAGVNVQQAMHLAGHTSHLVHQRYVMRTLAMRSIPEAALPRLRRSAASIVTGRDDSLRSRARRAAFSVGHDGLEPSANGLRVRCSTN